mmetsp:Transcript_17119/g.34872  ORF Transcript_17119/g.34872 Transcript_17119/m.34872 type:complete len:212 (+) Transcript_17119:460-1095(+)
MIVYQQGWKWMKTWTESLLRHGAEIIEKEVEASAKVTMVMMIEGERKAETDTETEMSVATAINYPTVEIAVETAVRLATATRREVEAAIEAVNIGGKRLEIADMAEEAAIAAMEDEIVAIIVKEIEKIAVEIGRDIEIEKRMSTAIAIEIEIDTAYIQTLPKTDKNTTKNTSIGSFPTFASASYPKNFKNTTFKKELSKTSFDNMAKAPWP